MDNYIGFLANQAGSNLHTIDPAIIAAIQPFYETDLRNVRVAFGINTIHGQDITIGNVIYLVEPTLNMGNPADAALLFHELQHTVQYARKGSIEAFMTEYILKSGGSILRGGNSVDIHDNVDLEREAINKAAYVSSRAQLGGYGGGANIGGRCLVPAGVCPVPAPVPVGASCGCQTQFGPQWGSVIP